MDPGSLLRESWSVVLIGSCDVCHPAQQMSLRFSVVILSERRKARRCQVGVEMLGRRHLHSCESAQEMERKLQERPELSPGVTHHLMLRGERSGSQAGCWLGPWGRGSSSLGSRDPGDRHWLMLRQAAQHRDTGSGGNGVSQDWGAKRPAGQWWKVFGNPWD